MDESPVFIRDCVECCGWPAGRPGFPLVLKSYAVLGKGENASHVNAFLQQLEYEAQTAAVRQVLPGLLLPGTSRKNQ